MPSTNLQKVLTKLILFTSDPLRLSNFLLETSVSRGVHLHYPYTATHITPATSPTSHPALHLTSPSLSPFTLPLPRLIITAGAWSPMVFQTLFPSSKLRVPVTSLAGHSILLRSPRWKSGYETIVNGNVDECTTKENGCQAVFAADEADGKGGTWSPEIFSRVGGEIYIAGLNDAKMPLPKMVGERKIDTRQLQVIRETGVRMMASQSRNRIEKNDDDLDILREGLCFRPVTRRGTPIVTGIKEEVLGLGKGALGENWGGCWIAAGHGPWGISLSLGTGRAVAGLVGGIEMDRSAMERVIDGLSLPGR